MILVYFMTFTRRLNGYLARDLQTNETRVMNTLSPCSADGDEEEGKEDEQQEEEEEEERRWERKVEVHVRMDGYNITLHARNAKMK